MWAAEYLSSLSLNHFSHLLLLPPTVTLRKTSEEHAGMCEKESRIGETRQDRGGRGGGVGRKRKKAVYSAFVLIIPPRLGDIQAASVPQLGFGRRVISGSLGSVYNILLYRALSEGGWRGEGCGSPSMEGLVDFPSRSMLGNEATTSLDRN